MSAQQKILVRGVNWLGDAVMSTPALERLRQALPEAEIALLTPVRLAEVWKEYPHVDRVIELGSDEGPWRIGRRLRSEKLETALIFPNSPRSALEMWFAGIPNRVGYARPWRNWFLTRALPARPGQVRMRKRPVVEAKRLVRETPAARRNGPPATAHHIYDYLHLVGALGADETAVSPRLHIATSEVEEAGQRFGVLAGERWFGLNAGAQYGPAKRWPMDRFIAVAVEAQGRCDCRWIVFGGQHESGLAAEITEGIRRAQPATVQGGPLNVAGKSSLRDLCVLLKICRVLLTNDSGPMHVAAAVGTPVVVPFGSTSPELTAPGLPGERQGLLIGEAPCAPCFLRKCPVDFRCMTSIRVEQVVEALVKAAG